MEAMVWIFVWLLLVWLLLLNFWNLAFLLGVFLSWIDVMFNSLSYIGASCEYISDAKTTLLWVFLLACALLLVKVFKHA